MCAPLIFVLGLVCCGAAAWTGHEWWILPAFLCLLGGLYTLGD